MRWSRGARGDANLRDAQKRPTKGFGLAALLPRDPASRDNSAAEGRSFKVVVAGSHPTRHSVLRESKTPSGYSSAATHARLNGELPRLLDFFAGSGLVSEALSPFFNLVWANDIDPKKAAVFCANHPSDVFHLGSIEQMRGSDVPCGTLSWASFPCQDLSLAGNLKGIGAARSVLG